MRVVVTAGPIPARLDSVKFLTNRFKGGLAIRVADLLSLDYDVTVVKWRHTDVKLPRDIDVVDVEDVMDYYKVMTSDSMTADAYILAAAVANLMPSKPWAGKFPSHEYEAGQKFNIPFEIAPRIIDEIKKKWPRSTLIGYKLFDGDDQALVDAGWHTLVGSKANVVFCNHPATAKERKIAVMPDGTEIPMTFDEHVDFIKRVIDLDRYRTQIDTQLEDHNWGTVNFKALNEFMKIIGVRRDPYLFGTVALRYRSGGREFVTTTRGKTDSVTYCKVGHVSPDLPNRLLAGGPARTVFASRKATMNAPFLAQLFGMNPECNWILHGHRQLEGVETYPYMISGTTEEKAGLSMTGRRI